jgi:uncharacterized protein YlxW (UPF0749 family)
MKLMRNAKRISVLLAALVLGILVTMQWSGGVSQPASAPDHIDRTIRQLELEQEELKRTVGRLRERLDVRQQELGASTETLEGLRTELVRHKTRAGLIDVRGPGLEVVLDDSQRPPGGNANDYLIHDFDLRDVINLLWMAGAEAAAVNGERIVNGSSVYCVGSTVMVNDTRLSPPYAISAIGDPIHLQDYLQNPGYLAELKTRSSRLGLRFEITRVDSMTIPAYRGSFPLKFAQPGS